MVLRSMNMKFYLVIALTICGLANADSLARIIGGKTAKKGQFPYQVSIRKYGKYVCSGSILNEYWIITTASCFYRDRNPFTAVVGTNSLSRGGTWYKVIKKYIHTEYDGNTFNNDIGLMKVFVPIQFNNFVRPIEPNTNDIGVIPLVTSGWGVTDTGYPDDLQYVTVEIVPENSCSKIWNLTSSDSFFCISTDKGQSSCYGDIGAPLVYKGKLVGIVSNGLEHCASGIPDTATNVSKYINWINNKIKEI